MIKVSCKIQDKDAFDFGRYLINCTVGCSNIPPFTLFCVNTQK